MIRAALFLSLLVAVVPACKKVEERTVTTKAAPAAATLTTGTVASDGTRSVPIAVTNEGYAPARIPGKPGEKLKLVFTRTQESECISQVVVMGAAPVTLPLNHAVEIPVTVPASGELKFACGMDMISGAVVAGG